MNIKLITKAMHTLSLLSEDDVQMVMKLRGLSEDERQMLMLVLEPGVKPSKKSSKKSAGGSRSARGESIKGQLSNRRQERQVINDSGVGANLQPLPDVYTSGDDLCQFKFPNDIRCSEPQDRNIHHLQTTLGYHPFVSTAQLAEPSSSQVTSETGRGAAGDAHHAASSGD